MARHYIGMTARGATSLFGMKRTPEGYPLLLLEENEVSNVELDFTDWLDDSETVSSATVGTEGTLTAGTPTVSSPKVTVQMSGALSWGRATITVTMSTGVKFVEKIEVRERQRYLEGNAPKDYQGWNEYV
jgi:hypothetical protein